MLFPQLQSTEHSRRVDNNAVVACVRAPAMTFYHEMSDPLFMSAIPFFNVEWNFLENAQFGLLKSNWAFSKSRSSPHYAGGCPWIDKLSFGLVLHTYCTLQRSFFELQCSGFTQIIDISFAGCRYDHHMIASKLQVSVLRTNALVLLRYSIVSATCA